MLPYKELSAALMARENCLKTGNVEWEDKWDTRILEWCDEHLPSGSGFDSGTTFDREESTPEKLIFHTSFHHMNEGGMYDGWTEHTVTVTPSFHLGCYVKVSGRNRNDIKDYIAEMFS